MKRIALLVIAATGIVGLTACDALVGAPTVIETPTVVWDPAEPTGGLYDDPYVQAAYAGMLGFVLSNNTGDFTIAQLTETTTANRIEEIWIAHLSAHGRENRDPIAFVGPLPRVPISVTEHPDGNGADVLLCGVSSQWYVSEDHPEATLGDGDNLSLKMVVVDDGGVLKLDQVRGGEGGCDPVGVAFGRFDPQPQPNTGSLRPPVQQER